MLPYIVVLYCLLQSLVSASVPFSVLTLVPASWDRWADMCWRLDFVSFFQAFSVIFFQFVTRACKLATQICCSSILGLGLGNQTCRRHPTSMGRVNLANRCGVVLFNWLLHILSHACTESFDDQMNDCDCLTPNTLFGCAHTHKRDT